MSSKIHFKAIYLTTLLSEQYNSFQSYISDYNIEFSYLLNRENRKIVFYIIMISFIKIRKNFMLLEDIQDYFK